jgi:hypothetical protein
MNANWREAAKCISSVVAETAVLCLCGVSATGLCAESESAARKDERHPVYTIVWRGDLRDVKMAGKDRNELVVYVNDIPIRTERWSGSAGGEYRINNWIGKGKNRIEYTGLHEDGMRIRIREADKVGMLDVHQRYLLDFYWQPKEAGKTEEIQADVPWSAPEADELDASDAGKAQSVREIRDILHQLETAQKKRDTKTLRTMAHDLFLPGELRTHESLYAQLDLSKEAILEWAKRMVERAVNPGERFPDREEQLRFVHGKRGILVFRGFSRLQESAFHSPYLFVFRDADGGLAQTGPWIFIHSRGKWQIWRQ